MASTTDWVYSYARYLFATGQLNWLTAPVNCMLVTGLYSARQSDEWVTAIPGGAILTRDLALTGLGVTSDGRCYGITPSSPSLNSALPCVAAVFYSKQASDGISPLIYYSSAGPGFPFLPQSLQYQVTIDQGAGGYFQV